MNQISSQHLSVNFAIQRELTIHMRFQMCSCLRTTRELFLYGVLLKKKLILCWLLVEWRMDSCSWRTNTLRTSTNRTSTRGMSTPISLLLPKDEQLESDNSVHHLHPFGCKVVTHDDPSYTCVFVGVNILIKNAYYLLHLATGKLVCSTGCKFDDCIFPYKKRSKKQPCTHIHLCHPKSPTPVRDNVANMPYHDESNAASFSPICQAEFSASIKDNIISVDVAIGRPEEKDDRHLRKWRPVGNSRTRASAGISAKMI